MCAFILMQSYAMHLVLPLCLKAITPYNSPKLITQDAYGMRPPVTQFDTVVEPPSFSDAYILFAVSPRHCTVP